MANSLSTIVEWLESLSRSEAYDDDKLMEAFKAQFPHAPLVALLEAINIRETRALERDRSAGTV